MIAPAELLAKGQSQTDKKLASSNMKIFCRVFLSKLSLKNSLALRISRNWLTIGNSARKRIILLNPDCFPKFKIVLLAKLATNYLKMKRIIKLTFLTGFKILKMKLQCLARG